MAGRNDEEEFAEYAAAALARLRRIAYLLCHDWHRADVRLHVRALPPGRALLGAWYSAPAAETITPDPSSEKTSVAPSAVVQSFARRPPTVTDRLVDVSGARVRGSAARRRRIRADRVRPLAELARQQSSALDDERGRLRRRGSGPGFEDRATCA